MLTTNNENIDSVCLLLPYVLTQEQENKINGFAVGS